MSEEPIKFVACHDHNKHTCIQIDRDNGIVRYIPLDISEGLRILRSSSAEFDHKYKLMVNYPVERAAKLYLSYGSNIGITKEASKILSHIANVDKEFIMPTKKVAKSAKENRAASRRATNGVSKPTKAGRRAVDPIVKPKPKATGTTTSEKRPSAAQMFQDLIMEGKLTDDKIFAKVQEKFGLDDNKSSYVKWYRNHLRKQGKNPPDTK